METSWELYRGMPLKDVTGALAHTWAYVAAVDAYADGLDASEACALAQGAVAGTADVRLDVPSVAKYGAMRKRWINTSARQRKVHHERRANKLEGAARSRVNGTSDVGAIADRRSKRKEPDAYAFARRCGHIPRAIFEDGKTIKVNVEDKAMEEWKLMLVSGDYEGFEKLAKEEVERIQGEVSALQAELAQWEKRAKTALALRDVD